MKHTQTEVLKPQFDVILRFEQQTERHFDMLIEKLAQVTGNTTRLCSGQPPHVSMGIFDIADCSDPVSARTVSISLTHRFPYTEELVVPLA